MNHAYGLDVHGINVGLPLSQISFENFMSFLSFVYSKLPEYQPYDLGCYLISFNPGNWSSGTTTLQSHLTSLATL